MRSYTQLRNTYGVDTKNTSSANLTQGDEWMSDYLRLLLVKADWPFLHRDRSITSVGPTSVVTVVAATDIFTTASGDNVLTDTGTQVTFTTTGTLPAGIATSTTYYLIFQTSTTFQVASTYANAIAGTEIDITDTGSGTHTVHVSNVTGFQALPYDIDQVESVYVMVGTTRYDPRPAPNRVFWDKLNSSVYTSDAAEYWFIDEGKIALWPRQNTDGNIIHIHGKIRVADLNVADYTTGNIDIITNGSPAVTGAGSPAWTTPMAGRWIRVTHSNTAASSGDGQWYEILTIQSATTLQLVRPYGGRSLTTGAAGAYTIGQMSPLPEAFQLLPELYGSWRYWTKENDAERAASFKDLLVSGQSDLFTTYGVNDTSMILSEGLDAPTIINPNLTITIT